MAELLLQFSSPCWIGLMEVSYRILIIPIAELLQLIAIKICSECIR